MKVTIKEVSEPRYIVELSVTSQELTLLGEIGNYSATIADLLSQENVSQRLKDRDAVNAILTQLWGAERRFRGVFQ